MPSQSQKAQAKRLVVGVTGRIGAGKTSAGKYLSSQHGFQYVRYSQVLSEWLAKDPENKAHLQEVGWHVMGGGMQAELNRRLIAQVVPQDDAVVDGLRHPIDYESLKDSFASAFHLLYIETSHDVRWNRLKGQGRYTSLESFEHADSHPVEQQIEMLRANAALVLRNEGSLQDLYVALGGIIRGFRKESRR